MERLHQTREEAIKWHRRMWTEMGIIEGDDCYINARIKFKRRYIQENFPEVNVTNNCFLCCYALNKSLDDLEEKFEGAVDTELGSTHMCEYCPLKWGHIENYFDWEYSDIEWVRDSCSIIAELEERTDNI